MAKLRALRLAKEAQDKAEADLQTTPEKKAVPASRSGGQTAGCQQSRPR